MSNQESQARDRQRAWALLAAVEDHPQVQAWLKEAEVLNEESLGVLVFPEAPAPKWSSKRVPWAIVATVTLALGIGFGAYLHFATPHYETQVGEQRDVLLPDGSRVTLNTDTALTVHYSDARRYIELKRGEALFAVRHNVSRPFDVAAGGTLTRALGTEFNVDLRTGRVTVSVLEGAVRVAAADGGSEMARNAENAGGSDEGTLMPAALGKGQSLEFRSKGRRVLEEKADLKRIDAWRTRRLEFSDTPLAEAVEEFNRYSTTRVTIGTPELASVRVSGVFRIGDADGFLFSLQEALKVETHESPGEVVLIRPVGNHNSDFPDSLRTN